MNLIDDFGLLFLLCLFITCFLFILFGLITVRKLRKNPATKNHLGVQFVHGWDILNVARALSLPKWLLEKHKNSAVSFLRADYQILHQHTSQFDRLLAKIFYGIYLLTGLFGFAAILLDYLGWLE